MSGLRVEWLPYLALALTALGVLVAVGLVAAGRGDGLAPATPARSQPESEGTRQGDPADEPAP